MPEVEEVFRMATQKVRPDPGALDRQNRGQRRRTSRRKAGVYMLVAILMIIGVAVAANVTLGDRTPAHPPKQTPPLGAQIVGLNGAVAQQIRGIPADSYSTDLNAAGTEVAFVTIVDGGHAQIATIGVDGSGYRVVTHERYEATYPRWSPDGSKIAYVSLGRTDNQDIFVIDADGSGRTRLTTSPAYDDAPSWSHDGSTIAYQSGSDASGFAYDVADEEIWTVRATGGSPTRLTHDNVSEELPTWSPNDRWIAVGVAGGISVMRPNGTGIRPLTRPTGGHGTYFMPRWSPDGTRIAFLTCCSHQFGTYPVPDKGPGAREGGYVLKVFVIAVATDRNGVTAAGQPQDLGVTIVTDSSGVSWTPSSDELLIYRWN